MLLENYQGTYAHMFPYKARVPGYALTNIVKWNQETTYKVLAARRGTGEKQ